MDGTDFVQHRSLRVGAAKAKEEWTAITEDPKKHGYEFEGEPSTGDLKVWVTMPKERLRDSAREIAHVVEVASKLKKFDPSTNQEALDNMLASLTAKGDALSFADCFIVGQKRASPGSLAQKVGSKASSVASSDLQSTADSSGGPSSEVTTGPAAPEPPAKRRKKNADVVVEGLKLRKRHKDGATQH